MQDEEAMQQWKKNPWFSPLPINRWNQWNYVAGWRGLSVARREEITEWVAENLRGPHAVKLHPWIVRWPDPEGYEFPPWSVFNVHCMDLTDLLHLKLRFSEIV